MKKILYFLLVLLAAPLMLACNEDDSVDYTEYYGWRDENNAVTELFSSAKNTDSAKNYFNRCGQSLKEPQH